MIIEANLVDILQKKIYPARIEIENKKILKITKIKTAKNYILPGFIDSHIHIESSMLPPSSFSKLALNHGTIATISDPHEIANVLGLNGVLWMIENAKKTSLKIYFGASPCVPATPFETNGYSLSLKDIETLLKRDDILYLSEVMNFPGVINNEQEIMKKINLAKKYHKKIDGHSPGLRGDNLTKYIKAGIQTDHEAFTFEEGEEKIKKGMKILIREGSAAKNYEALHNLIPLYSDDLMFCSDDRHPNDLAKEHIKHLVIRSLKKGYDLFDVLKIACINPILHYNLDIGYLNEGDYGDFIIVNNLKEFDVLSVFINGEKQHQEIAKIENTPNNFNTQMKKVEDFYLPKCKNYNVIEAIDKELITKRSKANGLNVDKDILLFCVVNRYQNTPPQISLIKGFGLKQGAIAQSIAHDSHNIVAVGCSYEELCNAVNIIIKHKGGIVSLNKNETKFLPLEIAGLMSKENPYKVAKKYEEINNFAKELGSKLTSPFMTLSFMALLVIPELKLSDKGLFDSNKFEFVSNCI